MSDKKRKETELKQSLMQKDKEQLVELYLQVKWERDNSQQDVDEHKEYIKALEYDLECFKSRGLTASAVMNILKENDSLKQQLKEKEQEIEKLKITTNTATECANIFKKALGVVKLETTKQVCDKIRKELSNKFIYFEGKKEYYNIEDVSQILDKIEKGETDNAKADNN